VALLSAMAAILCLHGALSSAVEHCAYNAVVTGSNPVAPTIYMQFRGYFSRMPVSVLAPPAWGDYSWSRTVSSTPGTSSSRSCAAASASRPIRGIPQDRDSTGLERRSRGCQRPASGLHRRAAGVLRREPIPVGRRRSRSSSPGSSPSRWHRSLTRCHPQVDSSGLPQRQPDGPIPISAVSARSACGPRATPGIVLRAPRLSPRGFHRPRCAPVHSCGSQPSSCAEPPTHEHRGGTRRG
jgi:hypothetical protein